VKLDGDVEGAGLLDRLIERDLGPVDGDLLAGLKRGRNVRRLDRTIEAGAVDCLGAQGDRRVIQLRGLFFGFGELDARDFLAFLAQFLEAAQRVLRDRRRKVLRQQVVAGVAVGHFHDITGLAEFVDIRHQKEFS